MGKLLSPEGSGVVWQTCLEPPSNPKSPVCPYRDLVGVEGVLSLGISATEIQSIPQPPHCQTEVFRTTQRPAGWAAPACTPQPGGAVVRTRLSPCHSGPEEESPKGQHLMPNDRPRTEAFTPWVMSSHNSLDPSEVHTSHSSHTNPSSSSPLHPIFL